jgi:hypothetical protein
MPHRPTRIYQTVHIAINNHKRLFIRPHIVNYYRFDISFRMVRNGHSAPDVIVSISKRMVGEEIIREERKKQSQRLVFNNKNIIKLLIIRLKTIVCMEQAEERSTITIWLPLNGKPTIYVCDIIYIHLMGKNERRFM